MDKGKFRSGLCERVALDGTAVRAAIHTDILPQATEPHTEADRSSSTDLSLALLILDGALRASTDKSHQTEPTPRLRSPRVGKTNKTNDGPVTAG